MLILEISRPKKPIKLIYCASKHILNSYMNVAVAKEITLWKL